MPLESKDYLLNCFSQRPLFWEGLTSSTYPEKNIILIVFDLHIKMLHVYMTPCIHIYEYIQGERDRALDPSYPGLLFVLI